jgi:hypothetical protein
VPRHPPRRGARGPGGAARVGRARPHRHRRPGGQRGCKRRRRHGRARELLHRRADRRRRPGALPREGCQQGRLGAGGLARPGLRGDQPT